MIGATYFELAFADPLQTMPSVKPWVYLGLQALNRDPDTARTHFFQDAVSFIRFGSANAADFSGEAELQRLREEELNSMLDLTALADAIVAARARAIELGVPRLEQAGGTWVAIPPRN